LKYENDGKKKVEEIYTRTLHPHNSLKNKLKAHHDLNDYVEHQQQQQQHHENGKFLKGK
jgi:hypothetical protein